MFCAMLLLIADLPSISNVCLTAEANFSPSSILAYGYFICPAVTYDRLGLCTEECSADSDCEQGFKCCSNGCGHQCMQGVTTSSRCLYLERKYNPKLIGAYIPQCDEDGSFRKYQCHGSTGYCWCVDQSTNKPISNHVRSIPQCSE